MDQFAEVLHSFQLNGDAITRLSGGQNTSIRVQHAVLKPVEDERHYEWMLRIIEELSPREYRLSKPIRSVKGTFVSAGWICTRFEQGHEARGCVEEKLRVSRSFHRDLSHISAKDFPPADHPWSKSHRIAWQEDGLPHDMPKEAHDVLTGLLRKVNRCGHYKMQLIHGDLAGNILFDETLPPLIIDFSPTIAPVEYAEAILVCDCIAWQGSTLSELRLLPGDEFYKEMIIRAVIFRLSVSAILSKGDITPFLQDYNAFKPIIDDYI